ncbi:MAG: ABC transporter permease subunit [Gemmatimonadetes bacterium]|nr:ABC transporter permease subunit [Gemmatimonadota bacterium]MYG23166.1 ABC transporter permease subunit [Gemmatimonadota bacterium]MYJ38752.1 ABC transporter permease subunit [Gemmatimonadota bacterium]
MNTRQLFLVARRELRGFFDQPTAYVLAVAFLGLGLYLAFRSLYAMSVASLRPFFDLMPWLLVVFVPAVAMKSLAEERRSHTLEWLVAQPLSEIEIVLGKFLGNWLFVMIALAGTLPMAIGVLAVSEADPGIMLGQYFGAALLIAQMVAIGVWASSMTRNQITAFILGAFVCFALVLIGTPIVQIGLPPTIAGWAGQLSVISHFENVARGVVDLRDLLYFGSTCGLFLLLAVAALSQERLSHRSDAFRRLRLGTGVIALAVLMLNLLGGNVRGRLDLTRDDLFTLSDGSREILGELDDVVNLTLFVSDDLPQEIQLILRDVRDLVADLRGASNGMLNTAEVNPDDGEDEADQASSMGVMPIEFNVLRDDELQVRRGYFGLAVTYADEQEVMPVVDRADDLEFRLVSAIANMTMTEKPTLAFMSGFEAKESFQYRAFRESLADRYNITTVDLAADTLGPPVVPDSVDVLVVAAPLQPVSPMAARAIDSYLDGGGAALLLMERHTINPQSPMSMPVTTGLEDLLATRGVEASDEMVFDLASSERVQVPQGFFSVIRPYPLWPIAFTGGEHAVVRDLGNASFGWAAPFTFDEDNAAVTALWTTTEGGGTQPPGGMIDPTQQFAASEDELGMHTLAVAIDPSLADTEAQGAEDPEDAEPGDAPADAPADDESIDAADVAGPMPGGRIIAVGDGDFLEDRFAQNSAQNVIFAANAVDWLAQDDALIGIRSKNRSPPALAFESDSGRNALKWGSLVGVPVLFILFGFVRVTQRATRAERRWNEGAEAGAAGDEGEGSEGGQ